MNMNRLSTLGGALIGSIAASACCILPAVLGAASVSSLGVGAALAPFRPYMIGVTVLLLGAGFYVTYRRPRAAECGPDGCILDHSQATRTMKATKLSKVTLWMVTSITIGLLVYPELSGQNPSPARTKATAQRGVRDSVLVFTVSGMTCGGCEQQITGALSKMKGVTNASASYQNGTATVRFKPGEVTPAKIRAAIEGVGYKARAGHKPVRAER